MALHLAESHITQWQGPLGMRNAFSPPRVKKEKKKKKKKKDIFDLKIINQLRLLATGRC